MKIFSRMYHYFNKLEKTLWLSSFVLIMISFLIFDHEHYLTLIASIIGTTSLIFNAKGNPLGQFLMIIFSLCYGVISYTFAYYGEMITYLAMTAPMALFALISWLKNPYNGQKAQVKINKINGLEIFFMMIITAFVTYIFYYILKYFHTSYLQLSTLSVTTSFIAVYLTFRRSAFFALGYAMNDLVLIILWLLATYQDISYLSVVICFVIFFINDLYGFFNWRKMYNHQQMGLYSVVE